VSAYRDPSRGAWKSYAFRGMNTPQLYTAEGVLVDAVGCITRTS